MAATASRRPSGLGSAGLGRAAPGCMVVSISSGRATGVVFVSRRAARPGVVFIPHVAGSLVEEAALAGTLPPQPPLPGRVEWRQTAEEARGQQEHDESSASPEARAVGCLLGAMAGNALGVPVQHDRHWQVTRMFPQGLTEFWAHDLDSKPVPPGHVTGEFELLMAVAHSLVSAQVCDVTQIARSLAERPGCDPDAPGGRRFVNPATRMLLRTLRASDARLDSLHWLAALPVALAVELAAGPMQGATSFSDRHEREPWGAADNAAAAAVAPLALAYRAAPWPALDTAVQEMCLLSHSHPVGLDGARVVAAALHWLLSRSPPQPDDAASAGPAALLTHLSGVAATPDMKEKLTLMRARLVDAGNVQSWGGLYSSATWAALTSVLARITYHDYATAGTEAAAVALWAFTTSWGRPVQAIAVAASFAGSAPVTTQLVGALAGAAHGGAWIPSTWQAQLENAPATEGSSAGGLRDEALAVAHRLATLRCTTVGLASVSPCHQ